MSVSLTELCNLDRMFAFRLAGDPSKRHAALDDLFTLPGLDKETTTPYGDTAVHIVVRTQRAAFWVSAGCQVRTCVRARQS